MGDLKVIYENDIDISPIENKKVAVIGYGSQGHAHALNLKDSGVEVKVGLRPSSSSVQLAEKAGVVVDTVSEVVKWADIIMILVPDEIQKKLYQEEIEPELTSDKALVFAHGFNIHFKKITPPEGVDVFMIAPKGPGHTVRREYVQGSGVPALVAVANNASGHALDLAKAYAKAIGAARVGVFETTFKEEAETDLFGEQAVLCGGVSGLIRTGFEVLVEAGYSPAMAYFECLHEMKLIVDLIYEGGISNMHYSISNTAEYGSHVRGREIIDSQVKEKMKSVLARVQSGEFAQDWLDENEQGLPKMKEYRSQEEGHLIETVGKEIRQKMKFPNKGKLVTEKD